MHLAAWSDTNVDHAVFLMKLNTLKKGLSKAAAVIALVVMVASLLPPAALAQNTTSGSDAGTASITQPPDSVTPSDSGIPSDNSASNLPAPSTGLDFKVNPNVT